MNISIIAIFWLALCLEVFAHGRSKEMIEKLNAPVPDWMVLAEPIKVKPIEDQSLPGSYSFRPRSGGATNSRNRVQIPERGIEFQVDYQIDYTGNNAAGRGVSLNPDGTKLIVCSGTTSHLYEITSNGDHREVPIRLPQVTYDEGLKGFITKWSWAGNDVLVGRVGITDETGHESIEGRLYVFHMKEQALARLDLSALNLSDTTGIEIIGIGDDLEHLRIRLGDRDFAVKADLKSPPKLLAKPDPAPAPAPAPGTQLIERPSALKKTLSSLSGISLSPELWLVIVAVSVLGLIWLLSKMKK